MITKNSHIRTLRLPIAVDDALRQIAARNRRSVHQEIVFALCNHAQEQIPSLKDVYLAPFGDESR